MLRYARRSSRLDSCPCPGITFTSGWHLGDHFLYGIDHAIQAASRLDIDEWEVGHELVAHVHDVRLGEEYDRVTIGVARGKMQHADVFSVQVQSKTSS